MGLRQSGATKQDFRLVMEKQVNFREIVVDELMSRKEQMHNDVERLADMMEYIALTDDGAEEALKTLADCRYQLRTILDYLDDLDKKE